jgi:hypothetical protein
MTIESPVISLNPFEAELRSKFGKFISSIECKKGRIPTLTEWAEFFDVSEAEALDFLRLNLPAVSCEVVSADFFEHSLSWAAQEIEEESGFVHVPDFDVDEIKGVLTPDEWTIVAETMGFNGKVMPLKFLSEDQRVVWDRALLKLREHFFDKWAIDPL